MSPLTAVSLDPHYKHPYLCDFDLRIHGIICFFQVAPIISVDFISFVSVILEFSVGGISGCSWGEDTATIGVSQDQHQALVQVPVLSDLPGSVLVPRDWIRPSQDIETKHKLDRTLRSCPGHRRLLLCELDVLCGHVRVWMKVMRKAKETRSNSEKEHLVLVCWTNIWNERTKALKISTSWCFGLRLLTPG